MKKLNTVLAFCIRECVTIDQSPIRKNAKTFWIALKRRIMNFGAIFGVYWRFNKVISTAENVLILNIILVEETFSAFNTIFGIDIDGVKACLHRLCNLFATGLRLEKN